MSGAFPSPGDEIEYNGAGEVTGWSAPAEPWHCDECGSMHPPGMMSCPYDSYGEYEEDDGRDYEEEAQQRRELAEMYAAEAADARFSEPPEPQVASEFIPSEAEPPF